MKANKLVYLLQPCVLFFAFYSTSVIAQPRLSKKNQIALTAYKKYFDDTSDQHLKEFHELVAIPSLSSIPSHKPDIEKAAAWIVRKMKAIGLTTAEAIPTNGNPVVFGSWEGAKGKPTILIYAHYDVQPVKEKEWNTPPFTATLENGKIYGRGTSDDKCGILIPLWAIEAMIKKKEMPLNVKFLFDGEEEIGSPNLRQFLISRKETLTADFALNADGLQFSDSIPSIWMGLRGAALLEFSVKTANYDAHSGLYGGKTPNAVKAMSEIIASFYKEDGSVAVEGFYNNVVPITNKEKDMIEKIPYDASADMKELGSTADVGDVNYSPLERIWYRPTLEIVGMQGGYTEAEGFASIIPSKATAKIFCRLVNNQSADDVLQGIVKHIDKYRPEGAAVTYKFIPATARAMKFPADSKAYRYLSDVLTIAYGRPPLQTAVGGTVGPLIDIKEQLGLYPYSFGVQLPDEKFHASNEFVRLTSLRKGQLLYCSYFLYVAERESKLKK